MLKECYISNVNFHNEIETIVIKAYILEISNSKYHGESSRRNVVSIKIVLVQMRLEIEL